MLKRGIPLILILLILLSAMVQVPLSVSAEEVGDVYTDPTEAPDDNAGDDPGSVVANGYYYEDGEQYFYKNGSRLAHNWYQTGRYQMSYDRTEWLYELLKHTGNTPDCSRSNGKTVFELAQKRGIIGADAGDYYGAVDRLFAAQTLVKALGYPKRSVGAVSDSSDSSLLTAAYYGYFIPDDNNRLFPEAPVTEEEFDRIIADLKLYKSLKGKDLTVFGDSIMYGYGNPIDSKSFEGVAEMIGTKYGMNSQKYAKSGAVMGITDGKSHIADQIRKAYGEGKKADMIILNGGTNDTWHADIDLGEINDGYDMSDADESSFTDGFEKAMWLIRSRWNDTPVIYIRSHRMKLGSVARQTSIGDRATELCEKWNVACVDLYNESEFDGNILSMAQRYTWDNDTHDRGIHPNALGYAKYYLPPIGKSISSLFEVTLIGDCNGDDEVNVIDVYYIQRYEAELPCDVDIGTLMNGDIDHNGELNIIDASLLQRGLAMLDISPYMIGEVM